MAMTTGDAPLKFAADVAKAAEAAFADGKGPMMEQVTPTTRDLLKYWFTEPFTDRALNFHEGQRRAILDVVYLHEVLRAANPREAWKMVGAETPRGVRDELKKAKYAYPKHLVKMATGTGKTWVMHALLVWQYLNARREEGEKSGLWTKNFLFVAPGLIVYERLLDAFCGKPAPNGGRDFSTSDLKSAENLFLPPECRDEVFSFLQNCTVRKEDFGRKATGDGTLAVMNWQAFLADDELAKKPDDEKDEDARRISDDLLPAKPGVAAGNALESLDAQYLRGGRLDFLKRLPDLMLVNDEAHHLYGAAVGDEDGKAWQKGIDVLARHVGAGFRQLDFTATPYEASGTQKSRRKDYFPHVVADYDLKEAINGGRVKTIVIDKRKALNDLAALDYNAVREGRHVVSLSDGQMLMLRAGLTKLKYLEKEFARLRADKPPKMMVVCEDTAVTPHVAQFLMDEGLAEDDVLVVDSNKQGEVGEKEWAAVKGRLFAVDKHDKPKVIVSVLMLREGFDVNNVCVIVPLRATNAPILLEQTLGRGLRLMWREPEYAEVKKDSRDLLLKKRTKPKAVLDMLYVIEHPNFIHFYDDLVADGLAGEGGADRAGEGVSDLVVSKLKDDYKRYDLFWPVIVREREETLTDDALAKWKFKPFRAFTLAQLRRQFAKAGERFIGQELTVKTTFGEYEVAANLFNANSYNEYLRGVVESISRRYFYVAGRQTRRMPALQVNLAQIAGIVDRYVREGLFGEPFDPFNGSDWKVLLCMNGVVTRHVVAQIGALVHEMETNTEKTDARAEKVWFSSVSEIVVREGASLELVKTVYERTGYPAHGGGLERAFLEFVDRDSDIERFVKVNEAKHLFARLAYLRADGLMGEYVPDFIVVTSDRVWIVETKASNQVGAENVRRKRRAAVDWCKRVNALPAEDRMERTWAYAILSDRDFYAYRDSGASFLDMMAAVEMTEHGMKGEFDLGGV